MDVPPLEPATAKSCGGEESPLKITLKPNSNTYVQGDTLSVQLKHKKSIQIDSTHYQLNGEPIALPYVINNKKLGDHRLTATHYLQGKAVESERSIRLLKAEALPPCGPTLLSTNIPTTALPIPKV